MAITSQLAFGAYSYTAAATGTGEVGRVDYDSALGTLAHFVRDPNLADTADGNIANLTPDPKVFWFENDAVQSDKGRLMVTQTYYTAGPAYTPAASLFSVYNAATLGLIWPNAPISLNNGIVNVYNIVTLTVSGVEYIYGIDYDNHFIFRIQITVAASPPSETYTLTDESYSYSDNDENTYTHGVDIATDGTNIYALFINTSGQYGGPYANSTIVRLDSSLSSSTAVVNGNLARNALNLKLWVSGGESPVSYFYLPAIGGEQHYPPTTIPTYNTGSKIQRIPINFTSSTAPEDLLINAANGTSDTGDGDPDIPGGGDNTSDYYDIAFNADGSKVFILKGLYTSSTSFTWRLYLTNMAAINALNSDTPPSTAKLINDVVTLQYFDTTITSGYVWALYFNTADNNVWFVRGNDIVICDHAGGPSSVLEIVAGPIGMGATPASNLAPSVFNINGAAIYGLVGTVKGAAHPLGRAAQQAAARTAAAEGEGEEER
ncbi:MAG: hypothetical protein LBS75_02840 [Synergistaceae bacterium]|jgi:hypothetical protein|nr:hypothetical protein [Synergistaceae bacterium]